MRKRDIRKGDYVHVKKIEKKDHGHLIGNRKIESFIGEKGFVTYIFHDGEFQYQCGYDCSVRFSKKYCVNFKACEIERTTQSSQKCIEETKPYDWTMMYDNNHYGMEKDEKLLDDLEAKAHKFQQFEKVEVIKGEYKGSVGEISDLYYDFNKNKWCFLVGAKDELGAIDRFICYEDQLRTVQEKDIQYFVQVYGYDDWKPICVIRDLDEAKRIAEKSIDEHFFSAELFEVNKKGILKQILSYNLDANKKWRRNE